MKCIDTHIHIWDFERARYAWLEGNTTLLNRNYLIEELAPQLNAAQVTEGVLVQAANSVEETRYMLEVAEQNAFLKGVIGWLPLMQPEEMHVILSTGYTKHPLLKGVRHLIHDEPDVNWLLQSPVIESLQLLANAGLPYDIVGVSPAHLETVLQLADKVPGVKLVLDHLNQPPIRQKEKFGKWGALMKEVAMHPNVFAKISGLGITSGGENFNVNAIRPYVEFVLEQFGSARCFCGGDWPVCLLASTYENAWSIYQQTLLSLTSETEVQKILYDNAKQFYSL